MCDYKQMEDECDNIDMYPIFNGLKKDPSINKMELYPTHLVHNLGNYSTYYKQLREEWLKQKFWYHEVVQAYETNNDSEYAGDASCQEIGQDYKACEFVNDANDMDCETNETDTFNLSHNEVQFDENEDRGFQDEDNFSDHESRQSCSFSKCSDIDEDLISTMD